MEVPTFYKIEHPDDVLRYTQLQNSPSLGERPYSYVLARTFHAITNHHDRYWTVPPNQELVTALGERTWFWGSGHGSQTGKVLLEMVIDNHDPISQTTLTVYESGYNEPLIYPIEMSSTLKLKACDFLGGIGIITDLANPSLDLSVIYLKNNNIEYQAWLHSFVIGQELLENTKNFLT